jgi:hypothetical protein
VASVATVTLRLSTAQTKELLKGNTGPVLADLKRRCIRVQTAAVRLAPVDRGRLRQSITHEIRATPSGFVGRVGSNLPYARWVHDGTGIYGPKGQPIRPKTKPFLAWQTRGITSVRASSVPGRGAVVSRSQTGTGWAYAREVKGVPPNPFLLKALPAALT